MTDTPTTPPPRAMETARDLAMQIVQLVQRYAAECEANASAWEPGYCTNIATHALERRDAETRRAAMADALHMTCYDCRKSYPIVVQTIGPHKGQEMHVSMEGRAFTFCKAPELRKLVERAAAAPASTAKEDTDE